MDFNDEKDYIMRIIKEMVRVLFSLMLGKQYKSVELPEENKYEVSGKALEEFEKMVDAGLINEAENILLESIDYTKKEEVLAAILFYQYVSEKDYDFWQHTTTPKRKRWMELKDWHSSKDMVKSLRCLWKPNYALFLKTEYDIKRQPLQEPLKFPQRHFLISASSCSTVNPYMPEFSS